MKTRKNMDFKKCKFLSIRFNNRLKNLERIINSSCFKTKVLFIVLLQIIVFNSVGQTLKWTEDFSSTNPAGWKTESNASTNNWSLNYNLGSGSACSGDYACRLAYLTTNDDIIITKKYSLTAGKLYYIVVATKRTQNFNVYIGQGQTADSLITLGTTLYSSTADPTGCTDITTSSYFVANSGDYCFGFRVRANSSNAQIDNVRIYETDPATITWTGTTSTAWATVTNWDLGRVPVSSDKIVIPSGCTNYPPTIPSGTYNEISITNGSAGTITVGNGSPLTLSSNLTISSTGNPVTIANIVSIGGNLSIGVSGSAFTYTQDSNITVRGTFTLGNSSLAHTYNFVGGVSALGNFTMGNASTQTTNISYNNDTVCVFSAANMSGTTVFYGAMNYTSNNAQLMMKGQYLGLVTLSNSGSKYVNGDLNLDDGFDLTGGKMYASDIKGLILGGGTDFDGNLSPFRGSDKSERWQTIIQASDLDVDLNAGDFFKALSFKIKTKASSGSFDNFVIKAGLTDTTKFYQDGASNFIFKETPLSVVYSRSSITTTSGWNNFDFDQFLEWDGTKNILVEITWYNSGVKPGGDDVCFIGPLAGSGADVQLRTTSSGADCRTATVGQNSNYKPQIKVNYLSNSYNINIAKNWNNTGTIFYPRDNTVTFDGSGTAQTIRTNESHFYNATFTNSFGYTISTDTCTVENTMTMTAGNFTTGANVLELGSSISDLGTLTRTSGTVIGYFKRWFTAATISNVLFPLGTDTYYRPGFISFSVAPSSGGSIVGTHIASDAGVYNDHLSTTPLVESSVELNSIMTDGYWNFSPNTLSGGTYDVELIATGFVGVTDVSELHMLKRPNATSEWALVGNHVTTTGTNSAPILERTGVTGFSDFVPSKPASTLPIELFSFNAECQGQKVVIKWSSLSEVNNNYYTIERSEDMINWQTIAQVNGAGNSNSIRNYSANDLASNSLVYYRLKQTDFDAKFKYFDPISLQPCDDGEIVIQVLVNPIIDKLQLKLMGVDNQLIQVSLNDAIGEKLFEQKYMVYKEQNTLSIDMPFLAPGLYLCTVKLSNGKSQVVKVMVAK